MTTIVCIQLASWNRFETRALEQVRKSNRGSVVETVVPFLLRESHERVTYHVWCYGLVCKLPYSYDNPEWSSNGRGIITMVTPRVIIQEEEVEETIDVKNHIAGPH